jgi:dolichol-phosphate mannosyltransferase
MDISIIIPAYNEERNVHPLHDKISDVLTNIDCSYEIIFINDGSTDETENSILDIIQSDKNVKLISFSRNFGHMAALIAGYQFCKGDAAITIDCDLQHPPELIIELLNTWKNGYDIVNTIRKDISRKDFFKKITSKYYYKLFSWVSGFPLEAGSADYRLVSRKVINEFNVLEEQEVFFRGMVHWFGFKSISVSYIANPRYSGATKYNLKKMLQLATNGITSFSIKPLQMVTLMGFLVSGLTFIYMIYTMYYALFLKETVSGWTSLMLSVLFLGGIQLISIGVLGEYIGKIFMETKNRPRFIINFRKGI